MERYDALFANQAPDYCERVLGICGFEGKEEYLEHEAEIIRECFGYIESGKSDRVTRYLLRDSQVNAELPVNNDGTLSAAELHELTGRTFTEEELNEILDVVDLENKEEYSFQEADSFLESYEAFKSELESQDDEPQPEPEPEPQALTLLDLKQRAEADITLSQVLQLLPLCGLREQEIYTEEDAVVFVECSLLHSQGKSPREIAQHFGVIKEVPKGKAVEELAQDISNLSQIQQQKLVETLAETMVNQRTQVEHIVTEITCLGLSNAIHNGELQAMIDNKLEENLKKNGSPVTITAAVETLMEERGMLLPAQRENPTLPSSSTN